jgi:hypothetical protein
VMSSILMSGTGSMSLLTALKLYQLLCCDVHADDKRFDACDIHPAMPVPTDEGPQPGGADTPRSHPGATA